MKDDTTTLDAMRQTIDRVDKDLIRLLKERMDAVRTVGNHKQDRDALVIDPGREAEVEQAWSAAAEESGLSPYFTNRILGEILEHSRRSQEPAALRPARATVSKVAYQGVAASYSELAVEKLFAARGGTANPVGYRTFAAVFEALADGEVDYALVPVENSLVGGVHAASDLLLSHDVVILDEEVWSIRQCLCARPGVTIESLREVRSHPVALRQCEDYLRKIGVHGVDDFDTAGAAADLAAARGDTRGRGVICSREAAAANGLVVLAEDIADRAPNETRFLLLGRVAEAEVRGMAAKTTLIFAVDDRCGALADCLAVFAERGINLSRLESRPHPETPWEYLFLADLEGHCEDDAVREAMRELRPFVSFVRSLGTYPSRRGPGRVPTAPSKPQQQQQQQQQKTRPQTRTQRKTRRKAPPATRKVSVSGVEVGGDRFTLILGPCAVETPEQIADAAELVARHGAHLMRGGAFKPRSSPRSFQGLGFAGLDLLVAAGRAHGLPVVTEVLRPEDVGRVADHADMIQVGARNMQNFALLKELGKARRPVLLKRGMSATVKELLQAAEYILDGGNQRVVLCERGIRTFETATRNTLDLSAVPVLKEQTDLPVIVDPSHAAGVRHLVVPLALGAAAVGADGLIIEAHPRPEEALCDKDQALTEVELRELLDGLEPILRGQGRSL